MSRLTRKIHPDTAKLMRLLVCSVDDIPEAFAAWQEGWRRGRGQQLSLFDEKASRKAGAPHYS